MAGDVFLLGSTLVADPPGRAGHGPGRRRRRAPRRRSRSGSARRRRAPTSSPMRSPRLRRRRRRRARDAGGRRGASRRRVAGAAGRRRRAAVERGRRLPRRRRRPSSACCRPRTTLVLERFFDDTGGMQLVVHAPYGGAGQPGLGLALRKRFCRTLRLRAAGGRQRRRGRALARAAALLPARRGRPLTSRRRPSRGARPGRPADADLHRRAGAGTSTALARLAPLPRGAATCRRRSSGWRPTT